jgi:hypothetical protein
MNGFKRIFLMVRLAFLIDPMLNVHLSIWAAEYDVRHGQAGSASGEPNVMS